MDRFETAKARKAGRILDRRSYIGRDGHEYLRGIDRSNRRHEAFVKYRSRCFVCGAYAPEHGYPGFAGEIHHRKCYCLGCIEIRCGQLAGKCHQRRPGFVKNVTEAQRAKIEFLALNEETKHD